MFLGGNKIIISNNNVIGSNIPGSVNNMIDSEISSKTASSNITGSKIISSSNAVICSDNIVSVNIEINNIDSKTVNCSVNCSVINKISSNVNNFSGNNVVNITFFLDQM